MGKNISMIDYKLQEINRGNLTSTTEIGIIDLQNKVHVVRVTRQLHNVVYFQDIEKIQYILPSFCIIQKMECKSEWSIMTLGELNNLQYRDDQHFIIQDKYGKPYKIKINRRLDEFIFWPESKINFYENKLAIIQ